jgi:glycosyltransferase involved in cell wall biosynthesis
VFGLVAVEALARGTPAIVHRFGALEEILDDTGAGLGYTSPQELHAALDRITADEALRGLFARRGREACGERYSTRHHLTRYLSLIATLARERGELGLGAATEAAAQAAAAEPVPGLEAGSVE